MIALVFPAIDPVLVSFGPFAIRWYALAYIVGILGGWFCIKYLNRKFSPPVLPQKALDDMVMYAVLGIILGGRLGYVLFYKFSYYLENPIEILQIWHGGMSFHGGLLGVLVAFALFCRRFGLRWLRVMDLVACATPIGLGLGRVANFINGELFGRVSDVPWAMVFPRGGDLPRHPSQLYEAVMEGVILFIVLFIAAHTEWVREKVGMLGGIFLTGYSLSRITAECFREPDDYLGFIIDGVTMGQLLSLPMMLSGLFLIVYSLRTPSRL